MYVFFCCTSVWLTLVLLISGLVALLTNQKTFENG